MKNKYLIFILAAILFAAACTKNSSTTSAPPSTGQGGSLARFTIMGTRLYTVDGAYLHVFDISNNSQPQYKNKVYVGWAIEAIFPFKGKLFIASNTAMYIYNTNNPDLPAMESYVQHLTGCDPVVANDSIAFLTIHGGNRCGSSINQLQVYDIRNIAYPTLIQTIPMTRPMGLGLKDSVLFVCDNTSGMRVMNVKNPYQVQEMYRVTTETFIDVIPMDSIMLCMMPNGVAFYSITNLNQIQKLGEVKD